MPTSRAACALHLALVFAALCAAATADGGAGGAYKTMVTWSLCGSAAGLGDAGNTTVQLHLFHTDYPINAASNITDFGEGVTDFEVVGHFFDGEQPLGFGKLFVVFSYTQGGSRMTAIVQYFLEGHTATVQRMAQVSCLPAYVYGSVGAIVAVLEQASQEEVELFYISTDDFTFGTCYPIVDGRTMFGWPAVAYAGDTRSTMMSAYTVGKPSLPGGPPTYYIISAYITGTSYGFLANATVQAPFSPMNPIQAAELVNSTHLMVLGADNAVYVINSSNMNGTVTKLVPSQQGTMAARLMEWQSVSGEQSVAMAQVLSPSSFRLLYFQSATGVSQGHSLNFTTANTCTNTPLLISGYNLY